MDLQTLHERTGIDKRKLRYCLDHNLIPGVSIKIAPDEAGRPRKFADDVGFGIVCAAKLLELGLPHTTIRLFLDGIRQVRVEGRNTSKSLLVAVLEWPVPARAYLGDGVNVRVVAGEQGHDFGWSAPGNPAKLALGYVPVTEVMLDLGQIRNQVFALPRTGLDITQRRT